MDTLLRIMIFFAIGINVASCNPATNPDKSSKAQTNCAANGATAQHLRA